MSSPYQRQQGFVIILVLFLLLLVSSFIFCGTLLSRPARELLDLQMAADEAQCAADGALEQVLANLEAGKLLTFQSTGNARSQVRAVGKRLDDQAEITATASVPAPQLDFGNSAVIVVRISAKAAKGKSGKWHVKAYAVKQERVEVPATGS